MARHPSARRVHRANVDGDDVFVTGVLESSVWIKQHGRKLIIAGIVLAVAITAILYTRSSRASTEARATNELNNVRASVATGNLPVAIREAESFIARFGGTSSGDEARLLAAELHLRSNQATQAIEVLEPVAGDLDEPYGFNGAMLLAAAHEAANQPNEAEQVYLRIGQNARFDFQRNAGLENAARIREGKNDAAGAAELYQRILDSLEETDPQRGVYQLRLGEVQAQVRS